MKLSDIPKIDSSEAITDLVCSDDIFVKSITLAKRGHFFPSHSHNFDHVSVVAAGHAAGYVAETEDGEYRKIGEFRRGQVVFIPKDRFHLIVALEPNTIWLCIHNTHGAIGDEIEQTLVKERVTGKADASFLKEALKWSARTAS